MAVRARRELKDVGWLAGKELERTWVRGRYLHGIAWRPAWFDVWAAGPSEPILGVTAAGEAIPEAGLAPLVSCP